MSSRVARCCIALALTLAGATGIEAQQRFFPQIPSFELPEASPRVHGLVGRVLSAGHGDSRFGSEGEAEVALGENLPVLALEQGRRPIVLGFGSQVYARFSLSDSKSALISNDWVAGFNGTATVDHWAFTLELYHESSHLGDEYEDRFNATWLDWTSAGRLLRRQRGHGLAGEHLGQGRYQPGDRPGGARRWAWR